MSGFPKRIKKAISKRVFRTGHQAKDRERTLAKWELIRSNLPEKPGSLLDIGCAEGFFVHGASNLGWVAWGVEGKRLPTVKHSLRKPVRGKSGDVFFSVGVIDGENVKHLPKFDVILLLSTFHKMCKVFGLERAYSIFDGLLKACNKALFFETAGRNSRYGDNVRIFEKEYDVDSIQSWVEGLVARTPGWKVRYIGKTHYVGRDRHRLMFLIEKDGHLRDNEHS